MMNIAESIMSRFKDCIFTLAKEIKNPSQISMKKYISPMKSKGEILI